MAQKKLEKGSAWEKLDTNDDGIITDDELKMKERLMRLENNDKKKTNKDIWFGFLLYQ